MGMIFNFFLMLFGIFGRFLMFFLGIRMVLILFFSVVSSFFFSLLMVDVLLCNVILLVIVMFLWIGICVRIDIIVVIIVKFVDGLFLGVVLFGMCMWMFSLLNLGGLIFNCGEIECI